MKMEAHHWGTAPGPMTPPHTNTVEARRLWVAPAKTTATYAYSVQLLTPPDDDDTLPHPHSPPTHTQKTDAMETETETETETDAWARDWLHVARTRPESSALVAEKTCEMICYLWFAPGTSTKRSSSPSFSSSPSAPTPTPSPLQLLPSPPFIAFTQKLLETTQLSQSAIVLALHFIHRVRARNQGIPAQAGSEFRVCVAALMMANKFLDDNTYTNATWASVSSIPLAQINTMEREFLAGCDYALYVSRKVYEDWGRLLRGLVGARARERERERERGRRHASHHRGGRVHLPAHNVYSAPRRPAAIPPSSSAITATKTTDYSSNVTPNRGTSSGYSRRERSVSPILRGSSSRRSGSDDDSSMAMDLDSDDRRRGRAMSHERADREKKREREREREAEVGTKRRAEAAFSPGSYHPPPHAHPGFASMYANAQAPSANLHQQRPAPTIVIPTPVQSTFGYHPHSAGSAHWSPVDAGSTSTTSSSSDYPPPSLRLPHIANGLATPLERFGAMSLSTTNPETTVSRHPTPSPPRRRVRPRPVSYAGSAASVSSSSFAVERYGYQPPAGERGRERSSVWGVPSGGRAATSSPGPAATYVSPSPLPNTTVNQSQHRPRDPVPSIVVGQSEQQQQYPSALAAGWDYSEGAKSASVQDLYFYALTCSPISDGSSSSSSGCSDAGDHEEDHDDDDSGMSDDGREAYDYRKPGPPAVAVARGRSRALSDARERERDRDPERYREEARQSRLRYAPAPIPVSVTTCPSSSSWLPAPQPQHPPFAAGNGVHLLNRWGVQSARTSPVRAAATMAESEWTPPRAAYAERQRQGWPAPVALPRFADLERWSGAGNGAQAQPQYRPPPPPSSTIDHHPLLRRTHQAQPRRAVFANAGPPGVSGYAYAY
ncbi:hypothetical protein C8F01DRAFT_753718 [Mycena amicta]|nr:hypothetical protein C8F01DRAFT_753718 [Mycena amicta]